MFHNKNKIYFWMQALDNLSEEIVYDGLLQIPTNDSLNRKKIISSITNFEKGKNLFLEKNGLSWISNKNRDLLLEVDLATKDVDERPSSVMILLERDFTFRDFHEKLLCFLTSNNLSIPPENLNVLCAFVKKKGEKLSSSKRQYRVSLPILITTILALVVMIILSTRGN